MRASLRAGLGRRRLHEVEEAADGRARPRRHRERAARTSCCSTSTCPVIDGAEVLARSQGEPCDRRPARDRRDRRPARRGARATMPLGADAYLTKPFGPPALLRTVERVLAAADPPAASP